MITESQTPISDPSSDTAHTHIRLQDRQISGPTSQAAPHTLTHGSGNRICDPTSHTAPHAANKICKTHLTEDYTNSVELRISNLKM